MNNLDNHLREMFRRHEADLAPGIRVPPNLARRTRGRQIGTALGSIALVVALGVGTLVGVRSLSGDEDSRRLGGNGRTHTTTINGITITYPRTWFAADPVDVGLEPGGAARTLPSLMLVLTSEDPGTSGALGCPGLAADGSQGHLLMTIQETPLALTGEGATPWPVPLQPLDVGADSGDNACYPDWMFLRSSWTDAGRSFEARLGIGRNVSETDRTALMDAYESMTFTSGSPVQSNRGVVGSGTAFESVTWDLTVDTETGEYCLDVQATSNGFGTCATGETSATVPQVNIVNASPDGAFAVGTVPRDVFSLVLETPGDVAGSIDLLQPPGGPDGFRYVVVPLPGEGHGKVRFQDKQGNDVYPPERIEWGGTTSSGSVSPEPGSTASSSGGT
jgi:hypothetical protein